MKKCKHEWECKTGEVVTYCKEKDVYYEWISQYTPYIIYCKKCGKVKEKGKL